MIFPEILLPDSTLNKHLPVLKLYSHNHLFFVGNSVTMATWHPGCMQCLVMHRYEAQNDVSFFSPQCQHVNKPAELHIATMAKLCKDTLETVPVLTGGSIVTVTNEGAESRGLASTQA